MRSISSVSPLALKRQDDVAIRHHSEVAVKRVHGIEHHRGRAGAGERGRDLRADVARFPYPKHDHLAARLHALFDQIDGAREILAQPVAQALEFKNFYVEDAFGLFKILHRRIILRWSVSASKNLRASPFAIGPTMKKHLLAALLLTAAAAATAHAQSYSAPINGKPRDRVERRPPPPVTKGEAGAIPRAVRGGNPVQMLNPRAPQRYFGHPNDTVTYDQENPSKITGIILFGFRW